MKGKQRLEPRFLAPSLIAMQTKPAKPKLKETIINDSLKRGEMDDELRAAIVHDIYISASNGRIEPDSFFNRCADLVMQTNDPEIALTIQGLANRTGIELHNVLARSILKLEEIDHG